jgi:hypothetical protein
MAISKVVLAKSKIRPNLSCSRDYWYSRGHVSALRTKEFNVGPQFTGLESKGCNTPFSRMNFWYRLCHNSLEKQGIAVKLTDSRPERCGESQ